MSDQYQNEQESSARWKYIAAAGLALAGIVVAVLALSSGNPPPKPQKQQTMRVVLPPPPPPKKEPEPEKVMEQPKNAEPNKPSKAVENKPAQKPNPAPASAPLTAAAGAGANAYGLAVGNGSGGSIGGGGGGGGGGGKFGAYGSQIVAELQAAISRDETTRIGKYPSISMRLWLNPAGKILRVQLVTSTGDAAMDQALTRVITALGSVAPPPADLPQPVNMRVRARGGL